MWVVKEMHICICWRKYIHFLIHYCYRTNTGNIEQCIKVRLHLLVLFMCIILVLIFIQIKSLSQLTTPRDTVKKYFFYWSDIKHGVRQISDNKFLQWTSSTCSGGWNQSQHVLGEQHAGRSSVQCWANTQWQTNAFTPTGSFHLTCMSSDCGRNQSTYEDTRADTHWEPADTNAYGELK